MGVRDVTPAGPRSRLTSTLVPKQRLCSVVLRIERGQKQPQHSSSLGSISSAMDSKSVRLTLPTTRQETLALTMPAFAARRKPC